MTLLVSYYEQVITWLQAHMLTCPSRQYLHIECPGCGLQRSILLLMQGDVWGSLAMYPAAIPMLWLFGFAALHLRYHFINGAAVIKYSAFVVGTLITMFYIYKIINHKIIS